MKLAIGDVKVTSGRFRIQHRLQIHNWSIYEFIIVYKSIKSGGRENEIDFSLSCSSTRSKNARHLGMLWLLCSEIMKNWKYNFLVCNA